MATAGGVTGWRWRDTATPKEWSDATVKIRTIHLRGLTGIMSSAVSTRTSPITFSSSNSWRPTSCPQPLICKVGGPIYADYYKQRMDLEKEKESIETQFQEARRIKNREAVKRLQR